MRWSEKRQKRNINWVTKCDKIKKTIDFSLIDGNIEGVEKSGETTRDEADSQ